MAWGETSTRTLAEMNELMRIVDARLASIESHIYERGADIQIRPEKRLKCRVRRPPPHLKVVPLYLYTEENGRGGGRRTH